MKGIIFSFFALISVVFAFFNKESTHNTTAAVDKTFRPPSACETATGTAKVVCLAEAFKATLSSTQVTTLQVTYSLTDAKKWSNLPQALVQTKRIGIQFGTLSSTQLAAAKELLKAATGTVADEGYAELNAILAADDYLGANGGGTTYGSGNYYMAFLGTPSVTGTWELQFGGHHFALANTYKDGVLVGSTPSFRASEPTSTFTYSGTTYQPVNQERASFIALLTGLSTTELASAKLSSTYSDILLGPGKDWVFPTTKEGLRVGTLSADKKTLVLNAIKTYVQDIDDTNAATILTKYTNELDQTYVAYSGTTGMVTRNDYIRIDGPSVWIEWSTQGGIVIQSENHPHSIWRDRSGDYGGTGNTSSVKNAPINITSVESYPNPATTAVNVDIKVLNTSDVKINIYDLSGRLMKTSFQGTLQAGNHTIPLDVDQLAKGIYMYSIQTSENGVLKMISKKMIKI